MNETDGKVATRPANKRDLAQVTAIYTHHVLEGLGSFEVVPPSIDEVTSRWQRITSEGLPYIIAELDGRIAGFAHASRYRARPGYKHTVENSVYVAHDFTGRGVGRTLLSTLIGACEALGFRQMVAVIGDSANQASIELHETLGFERAGTLRDVGRKHGRWIDTVLMQRALGDAATTPPEEEA